MGRIASNACHQVASARILALRTIAAAISAPLIVFEIQAVRSSMSGTSFSATIVSFALISSVSWPNVINDGDKLRKSPVA